MGKLNLVGIFQIWHVLKNLDFWKLLINSEKINQICKKIFEIFEECSKNGEKFKNEKWNFWEVA